MRSLEDRQGALGLLARAEALADHDRAGDALRVLEPLRASHPARRSEVPSWTELRLRYLLARLGGRRDAEVRAPREALLELYTAVVDRCEPGSARCWRALRNALIDDLSALGELDLCVSAVQGESASAGPHDGAAIASQVRVLRRAGEELDSMGRADDAEAAFHRAAAIAERWRHGTASTERAQPHWTSQIEVDAMRAELGLTRLGISDGRGLLGRARGATSASLADLGARPRERRERIVLLGLVQAQRGLRLAGAEPADLLVRRATYLLEEAWRPSTMGWLDPLHARTLAAVLDAGGHGARASLVVREARLGLGQQRGNAVASRISWPMEP